LKYTEACCISGPAAVRTVALRMKTGGFGFLWYVEGYWLRNSLASPSAGLGLVLGGGPEEQALNTTSSPAKALGNVGTLMGRGYLP
jgi:hypothetical protein